MQQLLYTVYQPTFGFSFAKKRNIDALSSLNSKKVFLSYILAAKSFKVPTCSVKNKQTFVFTFDESENAFVVVNCNLFSQKK